MLSSRRSSTRNLSDIFSSFTDLWVLKISEIFGPILPIVPVDDIRQAIDYINAK
jgi:hypothetical protein